MHGAFQCDGSVRRKLTLADLIGERWILQPPGHPIQGRIDKAFHTQGREPPH
jgi:hypothetical protein